MNWPQSPNDPNAPPPAGGYGGGYGGGPGGGGWGPPGGGPSFGPPGLPNPPPGPLLSGGSGLATGTIIVTATGFALFLAGLVPCLGWLNWIGGPTNLGALGLGIAGLVKQSQPGGNQGSSAPYIVGIVLGSVGLIGGGLRCFLGGGVV